ncbi:MAG TPA: hypothetical protein VE959_31120 [Bryobacteraceae bacterium]|nr:hypothetical protein [Bryobacteraceae bacterium]
MSALETLHYATLLSDALRRIHDEGCAHGALTPASVIPTASGLRLLPAAPGDVEAVTPYLAPERLHGHAPDTCTDIFAFGAVVYEMYTGSRAFQGGTPDALAESLSRSTPPCLDHLGLDRLVRACLCKDRAARMQRMQQVRMELKLLAASERRSEPGVALRQTQIEAALRAEIQQLETRWASRFEQQQETVTGLQLALAEARSGLEQQHGTVTGLQLALAEARSGSERQQEAVTGLERSVAEARSGLEAASEALKATSTQLGEMDGRVAAVQERLAGAEQAATGVRGEMTEIQSKLADEIRGLCQKVDAQAAAIQSARNSVTRTDDLVERVVDALEFLQSTVLEQSGDRMALAS